MIRFSCPGCEATLTVEDAKGGKAGTCPKCQARFLVPASAHVPPPPVPAAGAVEVAPCPKCGTRLSVAPADLNGDVECPYCRTVFVAATPGSVVPARSKRRPDPPPADEDEDDRPRRRKSRRRDHEDEYDRPSRRRRSSRYDDDDAPPKSRLAYILLALFLGGLGVHNFYAGRIGEGVIQLVLWVVAWPLLCVCYAGLGLFLLLFVWNIIEIATVDRDGDGRRMV